jgi:hypothetical protein
MKNTRMKIFWIWTIVAPLLALSVNPAVMAQTENLTASMMLNTHLLSEGETVEITISIKNHSSSTVRFNRAPYVYWVDYFDMFYNDVRLPKYIKIFITPRRDRTKNLVEILPGSELTLRFPARLLHETIEDLSKGGSSKITGRFLDFGNSAILINEIGEHDLSFNVKQEMEQNKFGVTPIWFGTMTSPAVRIHLH